MKKLFTLCAILTLIGQTLPVAAQTAEPERADTRVYLEDGTLVEGTMVEKGAELIIMRVDQKVFTFERTEIDKIVTLESLGGGAKTITVTEFPYISFMGGAVALGLLSWLQFDRSANFERIADQQTLGEFNLVNQEKKNRDKASRARLYGWSTAVLSAGSFGVSLIPRKATRRVFPELGASSDGDPLLQLTYKF
jgi:hypothetical protein